MNENDARIPYYVQVAETLRRRIMTDEYMEDSLIPPVPELEKEFSVSNITIRKALETLTQDGLLRRKRGVGTIVQKCERDLVVFELTGDFRRLVRSVEDLPVELEVLEFKIIPCPHYVQKMLLLGPEAKVLRIKKIRKHGGKPLSFYLHYTDPTLYKKITIEKAEQKTFVDLYEEITKTKLTNLRQRIESVVADIDLSTVLQVRFGLPLFFTENLYMTAGEKPAILTQNYYRGDKCFYKTSTNL
jgi:DNA-binding GntR family transcriptional regulator